jgi:hypothetical protein
MQAGLPITETYFKPTMRGRLAENFICFQDVVQLRDFLALFVSTSSERKYAPP